MTTITISRLQILMALKAHRSVAVCCMTRDLIARRRNFTEEAITIVNTRDSSCLRTVPETTVMQILAPRSCSNYPLGGERRDRGVAVANEKASGCTKIRFAKKRNPGNVCPLNVRTSIAEWLCCSFFQHNFGVVESRG